MLSRQTVLVALALVPMTAGSAFAGPKGGTVVGGSATIQGQGTSSVVINQLSQAAIINWQTFNINSGETVQILMPNSSSAELDRVTGNLGPSQIFGSLSSNGRVFLVNPNGILFGQGAEINVGSLLATTSNISNANFMAGRYNFSIPGNPSASIVNQGTITAKSGGFAALVAPGVRNTGTITAWLGRVGLASANTFALDLYGDRLIQLDVNDSIASQVIDVSTGQPLKSLVSNEGKLKANGGTVQLTAVAAREVVSSVINNSGVIEANSIGTHNGMIVLSAATTGQKPSVAPKQTVTVSGKLSAAGKRKGTTGGTILIDGENIALNGATINASGASGGGAVLIGGDWGGGNPNKGLVSDQSAYLQPYAVPNASTVSIDAVTTINASATGTGNGGKVIVWSDLATAFYGTILAQGGAQGGNGGFVETSGGTLAFSGTVDTSAPNGKTGVWLLDPVDLTVGTAGAAAISAGLANNNVVVYSDANGNASSAYGTTATGTGNIAINAPISWSSVNTLTVDAYNALAINASISGSNGALVLNAGSTISATAAIAIGTFDLQSGNWSQVSSNLPSFSATDFTISGGSFLRATGGNGTVLSPYQITDVYGLEGIGSSASLLDDNYILANNIDASGTPNWNNGAGFVPIGNLSSQFTGTFNGNGNIISNLVINLPSSEYVGLFGLLGSNGLVENVGVVGGSVTGNFEVGGLAGGIFGTIKDAYATDAVTGNSYVGGLVGGSSGLVTESYAAGTVTGNNDSSLVGGLIGANGGGTVSESYAIGVVIAGSGSSSVGGLIGGNGGNITSSYWNTQTSGQTVSDGGIGLTTAQFQSGLPSGFDATVWSSNASINNGYPYLSSVQLPPGPPDSTPDNNPITIPSVDTFPTQQTAQLTQNLDFAGPTNIPPPVITLVDISNVTNGDIGNAGTGGNGNGGNGSAGNGGLANGKQGGNGAPPGVRLIDMPHIPLPPGTGMPPLNETRFLSNQLVLQFDANNLSAQQIAALAARFGLTVVAQQTIGMLGRPIYTFSISNGQSVRDVIRLIESSRLKVAVQPQYTYGLTQEGTAADQTEVGDPAQYVVQKLQLTAAHRISKGANVVLAVIDSAIDAEQPDFAGRVIDRYDAGCGSTAPDAHGTGMAGAIASHVQLVGVAPSVKIIAICAFGGSGGTPEATSVKIIRGLDYAVQHGAKIVNMSFAGPYDPALAQALQVAREKGVLIVAAAGNAGAKSPPLYPGADPNVLAVTATDENDHLFAGANQGKYIALAAPGVNILVPAPDGGVQMTTGTSVATANVSGVAALLSADKPSRTPEEIRAILVATAKHLGTKGINPEFGAGLVDPVRALQAIPPTAGGKSAAAAPAGRLQ